VGVEVWSATSYGELQREGLACERAARLQPGTEAPVPWVTECLGDGSITVAVSDNMTAVPKLIERWVGGDYVVLGTDGFGRSDTREKLRRFFEVDKENIVVATLSALAKAGKISTEVPAKAIANFGIKAEVHDITRI